MEILEKLKTCNYEFDKQIDLEYIHEQRIECFDYGDKVKYNEISKGFNIYICDELYKELYEFAKIKPTREYYNYTHELFLEENLFENLFKQNISEYNEYSKCCGFFEIIILDYNKTYAPINCELSDQLEELKKRNLYPYCEGLYLQFKYRGELILVKINIK